ncbi:MAG: ribonuclease III [bacterium]
MSETSGDAPLATAEVGSRCDVEGSLGHRFAAPELLEQALTHRSLRVAAPSGDNERLEFLGDAVLDLVVSAVLFGDFPDSREGDLSRKRAYLVSTTTLAETALRLGLESRIRLGKGEEATGGRGKASILANVLEALIGAVFVDAGFDAASAVVRRLIAEPYARLQAGEALADHKTQLQERCQEELRETPTYRGVSESGPDHEKIFEVEVEAGGEVLGRGRGRSKKEAEQMAAWDALESARSRGGFGASAAGERAARTTPEGGDP